MSQLRNPRATLEFCMQEFELLYGNKSEAEYASSLADDIVQDMLLMQIQPAIMKEYRRFVILKAEHDQSDAFRDLFECTTVASFECKDWFHKYDEK